VKLLEYQTGAKATAIYPSPLIYPALGLCGEIGELIQAVVDDSGQQTKEAGDVLWYIANTAADADLALDDVAGRKTFPKEPKGGWKISQVLCDLSIQAGIVAEHVKTFVSMNSLRWKSVPKLTSKSYCPAKSVAS
jgi:NTP pyrophosphatase (non-canonical NTP hydrolase)